MCARMGNFDFLLGPPPSMKKSLSCYRLEMVNTHIVHLADFVRDFTAAIKPRIRASFIGRKEPITCVNMKKNQLKIVAT
jgi:hypothetical protein